MPYPIPTYDQLVQRSEKFVYNGPRNDLINLLQTIASYIHQNLPANSSELERHKLHLSSLGLWFTLDKFIADADFTKWDVLSFNFLSRLKASRSRLHQEFSEKLGTTLEHPNNIQLLIWINKFYQYLVEHEEFLAYRLISQPPETNFTSTKNKTLAVLATSFERVSNVFDLVVQSIPTEQAIDSAMPDLLAEYIRIKEEKKKPLDNNERIQLLQIAQAISGADPFRPDEAAKIPDHLLSRSHRVKLAIQTFIMQAIWDEYWIRYPQGNSVAFDAIKKRFGDLHKLDPMIKRVSFEALQSYMQSFENRDKLEKQGLQMHGELSRINYIDGPARTIQCKIEEMLRKLPPPHYPLIKPVAAAGAAAGAFVAAAPFHSIGVVCGEAISKTNDLYGFTYKIGQGCTIFLKKVVGEGQQMGNEVARALVSNNLQSIFGALFQMVGMTVGAAAVGGACGLTVTLASLGYEGLRDFCLYLKDVHSRLDPALKPYIDIDFVECILTLPREVLSQEKLDLFKMASQGRKDGVPNLQTMTPARP